MARVALESQDVARPKRNWIQEERRKTLGDWVAFCLRCGHTLRFFLESEDAVPANCPQCGGELRHRCPSCGAPIASAFAVACEECDAPLRDPELFGTAIRKPGR
jgi:predicted nucleic acid-binding Zn ribbon protein